MIIVIIYLVLGIFFGTFLFKKCKSDNSYGKEGIFKDLWHNNMATTLAVLITFLWILVIPVYIIIVISNKIINKIIK